MTPAYAASLQALAQRQADALRLATARIEALERRAAELAESVEWLTLVSSDEARDEALAHLRVRCQYLGAERDRWRERAWKAEARRFGEPWLWEVGE